MTNPQTDEIERVALKYAREAVAQYEERHGTDQLTPQMLRDGRHDGWERVQCAKAAVIAALTPEGGG